MTEINTANRSTTGIMVSLSIMMFLEFFIWGAWYVTMSTFMTEAQMVSKIGLAYMLCPIAAIISPFFLGMVADRFFSSERVLAVLMLIGGAAMFFVPSAAQQSPGAFLLVILVHAMCYMPTLGLTNTIAFANMTNQEKQFPLVRVFGTLGWIVAGLIISFMGVDKTATPFMLAGGAAVIMGIFSFMLPHTPPPAKGKKASVGEILGADALALFKSPSFVVFALASFLICIPLAAYYSYAGRLVNDLGKPVGSTMSIGQAAEVIFMLLMPMFFARLGVKWMLAVGMLSWVARYALFAAGAPHAVFALIVLGIALHGMCYDFFFVTGFIYTDKKASKDIRGQAQGLLVLITQGLGLGIGAYLTGEYFNSTVGGATGAAALMLYPKFWWACAAFALVVLVIFVLFFRDDSKDSVAEPRGFAVEPAQTGAV
jgi:nucleoside transporter